MVDGIRVDVNWVALGGGRMRVPHTKLVATMLGPEAVALTVRPRTTLGRIVQRVAFGRGRPDFASRFDVGCENLELARVTLHEAVRRAIAETRRFRFRMEGGRVYGWCPRVVDAPDKLQPAMRAVASLAAGPATLETAWREACRQLDEGQSTRSREGWPRLKGRYRGTPIAVTLHHGDLESATRVEAERGAGEVTIPEAKLNSLNAEVQLLERVVRIELKGICDDASRLAEAIALSAEAAAPRAGGYR